MASWRRLAGDRRPAPERLPDHISAVRAFHIGGYWRGPNDMVRHMMLGLRSAGATVFELCTDRHPDVLDTEGRPYDRGTTGPVWIRSERLRSALERWSPHLIICNAGGLAFRPAEAARWRRQMFLLGIALSDPDVFEPTTRHIAPHFDAFLTNAPACLPGYEAIGVPAAVLPIATNDRFFHPVPPRPHMECDVVVLGRAHPDRVEPVRALSSRFATHVYGEGWTEHGVRSRGLIFGEDVLAALNSARMSVVFHRTAGGHGLVKVGLFDFAAAGALVVTNRSPDIEPYLSYGEEIVGFSSTSELIELVAHYLAHPGEAERIRRAGRQRVLRDHTWRTVWPRILDTLDSLTRTV
jgi:hypothetical protein